MSVATKRRAAGQLDLFVQAHEIQAAARREELRRATDEEAAEQFRRL